MMSDAGLCKIQVARRFSKSKQDVWSLINELAAASPVKPVVNMSQGFFGYNPPQFIRDAVKVAIDQLECNQYAPTKGRLRLRQALSNTYTSFWGRQLDATSEICITTGANEGMLSIFMAFLNPGDEVILFEPYFDQYLDDIRMTGASFACVPLHPPIKGATEVCSSSEWTIDFQNLEEKINSRTKMLIVNSPHNPTGKVYSRAELQRIGDLCVQHNIIIVSDEVYDRLDYVPFTRIATLSPEIERLTFTVGSVGKDFYCTGWRIGWVIGPAHLIDHVAVAHLRICYCTPNPLQEAAAFAYEQALINGFWPQTRIDMRSKIDRFCEVFKELGIPYSDPEGGYFVLANMAKVQIPKNYHFPAKLLDRRRDFHLAYFLIVEFGVASIPPSAFYSPENEHLGQDHLRFSVCKDDAVLEAAKERLRELKAYIRDE